MRSGRLGSLPALLPALAIVAGCGWSDARILSIEANGGVRGLAYIGDGTDDYTPGSDTPLPGLGLSLVRGTDEMVAHTVTQPDGVYRFGPVPSGTYRIVADPALLGDSLRVDEGWSDVTVLPGDTIASQAVFSYRLTPVAEARLRPRGARVSLVGVALNASGAFADGVVYVADASGSIRLRELTGAGVVAGDSVEARGHIETLHGQPGLARVVARKVSASATPQPRFLSTSEAAAAQAGALDGVLARIAAATVLDAYHEGDETIYLVEDGSGPLRVLLRGFSSYRTGTILDATGVLAPTPGDPGRWSLRARDPGDLVGSYARFTTGQLRALAPGRLVAVTGVALSGWGPFGGSTLHLGDESGAIRAFVPAQKFVEPGYRIELVGTLGSVDGHPVLRDATVSVLGTGPAPTPSAVTAATARTADEGRLDAALVRVLAATVRDSATVGGDMHLRLEDSAGGTVTLVLSRSIGFDPARYPPGTSLNATGLLIPAARREWMLYPRFPADLP